ncbi:hypothetical protein NQ318_011261 [Aromia moschata]|uniref:LEM domain-containing protein n=1 Tax=Aromia moschata TaxID=1265417 RepID=A0AAV8YH32_9CUCU|nr:hypothetical protein NQ318_011261 [Aromia moschata]
MVDVDKLTDAELRTKLLEFGFPVMPITGTTRKVFGEILSEEDSDPDVKVAKKKENRRATMAAPIMQPPVTTTRSRKSTRLNDTPEPEIIHSPPKRETRTTTSTTSTRTQKIIKSAHDEFDTGSDSESDIVTNNYNSIRGGDLDYKRSSPIKSSLSSPFISTSNKYSPPKSVDTSSYSSARNVAFSTSASPSRLTSYNSPSSASDYASDRLNQIRSRLSLGSSGYDKPLYSASSSTPEKEETPFLSNFTKRLSAMSSQKNDYDYKNDIIKEHDTNGSGYARSQLSSLAPAEEGGDNFVVINHVRDMILPVAERKRKQNTWTKAVKFINENESRVRTEVQEVQGEPLRGMEVDRDQSQFKYRQGRRIVDAQYLITEVLNFPHKRLRFCSNQDMEIKNEIREGSSPFSCCIVNAAKGNIREFGAELIPPERTLQFRTHSRHNGEEYSRYLDELLEAYDHSLTDSQKNDYELKRQNFLRELEKSPEEIENIAQLTVSSRAEPLWYAERRVRLTASNFGRICNLLDTTNRANLVNELLNSSFAGFRKVDGISSVIKCGLYIHQDYPFLAATPDGLIGDDAIIEVKCPYKAKDLTPEDAFEQKQIQFASLEGGVLTLKRTDKYYYQVQGQLFVTGRKVCYFVVWTPLGLVYEKILRDDECWSKMFPKLEKSPRNKSWQGQAFETQVGSVNSLPCSPTPCLKIRGMVEDGDRNTHMIREAVLSKCAHQCRILHCAVDTNSKLRIHQVRRSQ